MSKMKDLAIDELNKQDNRIILDNIPVYIHPVEAIYAKNEERANEIKKRLLN